MGAMIGKELMGQTGGGMNKSPEESRRMKQKRKRGRRRVKARMKQGQPPTESLG